MEIKELVQQAHENARKHGFWEDWKFMQSAPFEHQEQYEAALNNAIGNRLMLVVGEVSEAHEALRKEDEENFAEELADIVIRVADLAGGLGIDLEAEILKKMDENRARPWKHGKAF